MTHQPQDKKTRIEKRRTTILQAANAIGQNKIRHSVSINTPSSKEQTPKVRQTVVLTSPIPLTKDEVNPQAVDGKPNDSNDSVKRRNSTENEDKAELVKQSDVKHKESRMEEKKPKGTKPEKAQKKEKKEKKKTKRQSNALRTGKSVVVSAIDQELVKANQELREEVSFSPQNQIDLVQFI